MARIRILKRNGMNVLSCTVDALEGINDAAIRELAYCRLPDLLAIDKVSGKRMLYAPTAFCPLIEYIKTGISARNAIGIILGVIDVIKQLDATKLPLKNLLMDLNYVFIDCKTCRLQFVYLPVANKCSPVSVVEFIKDIVFESVFSDSPENMTQIKDFITYINNVSFFSVKDMESYIMKSCGAESYVGMSKKRTSGYIADSAVAFAQHYGTVRVNDDGGTVPLEIAQQRSQSCGYSMNQAQSVTTFLIRNSSGERVRVDKMLFALGSEMGLVDYCITNNKAVSRHHADIIRRGAQSYIVDKGSTNHTYVDGQRILSGKEVILTNGAEIRLANEAFVFYE